MKRQNTCTGHRGRTQSPLSKEEWVEKPKNGLWRKRLRWYVDTFPNGATLLPFLKSSLVLETMVGKRRSGLRAENPEGWCFFLNIFLRRVWAEFLCVEPCRVCGLFSPPVRYCTEWSYLVTTTAKAPVRAEQVDINIKQLDLNSRSFTSSMEVKHS